MQYLRRIEGLFIAEVLLECERYPGVVEFVRGSERAAVSVHCMKSVLDLKHRVFFDVVANFAMHVLRDLYKTYTRKWMFAGPILIFSLK